MRRLLRDLWTVCHMLFSLRHSLPWHDCAGCRRLDALLGRARRRG